MIDDLQTDASHRGFMAPCGVGVSMAPPTLLPSWWDFNQGGAAGLADRAAQGLLATGAKATSFFLPDFMAQVLEEEVRQDYFKVLTALDSPAWNSSHYAFAALAKLGLLRAIVTTNFDQLLERALGPSAPVRTLRNPRKLQPPQQGRPIGAGTHSWARARR